MIEQARAAVAEALGREDVEGVLALRAHGTAVGPHIFRRGDGLEDLALAPKYALPTVLRWMHQHAPDARIAAVLRGCEERALVELAKRRQVDMSKVEVLGLACTDEEARECGCVRSRPSKVVIGTPGQRDEARPVRKELPPVVDGGRLGFWRHQYSKCIKCYGCRDVCPVCACEECMMSEGDWVQGGSLPPAFATFFLIKAYHMADRCVECRECESACPVGIPLTEMYGRLVGDVERRYRYVTGRSEGDKPPLLTTLMDAPILDAEQGGG